MKEVIGTDAAPAAVGADSRATATEALTFTAGQLPLTSGGELLADANVDDLSTGVTVEIEAIAPR